MNKADVYLKKAIYEILHNGEDTTGKKVRTHWDDGSEAHYKYITNWYEEYDLSKGEFPIATLRPVAWKSAIREIFMIYQKPTNILKKFEENKVTWWNGFDIGDGTIGQRYGATIERYNLMNKLLNGLREDPLSRRHLIDMYQYKDLEETSGLYPCAFLTEWNVRGQYLDMLLVQRSNDTGCAYTINLLQYSALLMMVAQCVGLKPGKICRSVANLHIYDRHEENMAIMYYRNPSEIQPKLVLKSDKTNFYDFTVDDFELVDFKCNYEQLKFEVAK